MDHLVGVLGCQVELVEWHEESTEQSHQQTQVDAVFEVRSQISDFEVKFVQVLVDESDERLLDDLQFLGCVVEEGIEGIAFTAHTNVVISTGDGFLEFPKKEVMSQLKSTALTQVNLLGGQLCSIFLHHDDGDGDVLWKTNRCSEVADKGDQQMQDGNDVLGVNAFDGPFGSRVMEAESLKIMN